MNFCYLALEEEYDEGRKEKRAVARVPDCTQVPKK
jgi:hypothetical protein